MVEEIYYFFKSVHVFLVEIEMLKTKNEINMGLYNEENTKDMCVWIMKRIVRSGLEIVSEREGCFTRDLRVCLDKFSKYYPDKEKSLQKALSLVLKPTNDLRLIEGIFDGIGKWLVEEGKRIDLIFSDCKNLDRVVVKNVRSIFGERIICILRYGPRRKFDGSNPTDFDFLILLDKYNKNDYQMLSVFGDSELPIEVFVDYRDQIISKGIRNYQRGRHGSYK